MRLSTHTCSSGKALVAILFDLSSDCPHFIESEERVGITGVDIHISAGLEAIEEVRSYERTPSRAAHQDVQRATELPIVANESCAKGFMKCRGTAMVALCAAASSACAPLYSSETAGYRELESRSQERMALSMMIQVVLE